MTFAFLIFASLVLGYAIGHFQANRAFDSQIESCQNSIKFWRDICEKQKNQILNSSKPPPPSQVLFRGDKLL